MLLCYHSARIFLFSLFALSGFSLHAAMIQTSDGSKIKGKILVTDQDFVSIENSLFGVLNIPKNTIVSISDQDQTLDQNKEEDLSTKKILTNSNSKQIQNYPLESKKTHGDTSTSSKKNTVNKFANLLKKISEGWKSEVGFEFKRQSGNTEKEAYATEILSKRKTKDDLFQIKLNYKKEETNGIDSKDQSKYSVQYDSYLYKKFGWFIRQDFEVDQIIQIDYQSVSSLGLAYRFIDNETQQLRGRIGLGFDRKVYQNKYIEEQIVGDMGISHKSQFCQWGEFTSELKLVPSFETSKDFTFHHDSGLIIPIAKKSCKIRFGVKNNYRNFVQNSTIEKLDSQYYTKLIFSF